ncbi:MAG: class I SAM-dependent methyltransferase [Longimicrobiales bacterium]
MLEAGLEERVTVLRQDYRDLRGAFDKLVSIEMIEAVGHEHYDGFFAQCSALVKPDGRAVIQAITIREELYDSARCEVDFIKRHIFPGCCIPSREVLAKTARRNNLHILQADEIGLHYAETLHRWRDNLRAKADRVQALGFDQRFQRMWDFYFCYCEGGFLEGAIGTAQIVFAAAGASLTAPLIVSPVPPSPRPVAA